MTAYILEQLNTLIPDLPEPFALVLINLFQILVIVLLADLFKRIINRYFGYWMQKTKGKERSETLEQLMKTTLNALVWFLVILLSLDTIGVNITPILASAGVLGLAIGFGSQNIVRDVVTGFFHFFDNAFNVGEVIEVAGFTGTVTVMTLRKIHLVNYLGAEKIIPQGEISSLINWSRNHTVGIVDFGVAYDTDLKTLHALMLDFTKHLQNEHPELTEEPAFLGVMELADSSINCRLLVKTAPNNHWAISRIVRAELIDLLAAHKIEIPFPHVVMQAP